MKELPRLLVRTEVVKQNPPAALLTCKPAPAVPGAAAVGGEVATYIVDLDDAGQDCREKLQAVKDWAAK